MPTPRITKSLWRYIFNATHRVPASTDLVAYADHTGTPMVTNINECTVAELVTAGGGAPDIGLRKAKLKLTNAQILALPTVPQIIVPSVANNFLLPFVVLWEFNFAGGNYTNIEADGAFVAVNASTGNNSRSVPIQDATTHGQTDFTTIFGNASVGITTSLPGYDFFTYDLVDTMSGQGFGNNGSDLVNSNIGAALRIEMGNGASGNLTGGNAANVMGVTVFYAQFPSALV